MGMRLESPARFSDAPTARVAIRIEGGDYVTYPFDANGIPTESDMAIAKVGAMSVNDVFEFARFIYQCEEIAG